jgi:aspartyl-tRNA(Asn)/glutamyl-tRNA(Gln) amidotransferase subunit A
MPAPPMTIREMRDTIRTGARSAVEVCRDALARIDALDPQVHAFNTVVADRALARAAEIDRDPVRWRDAPLAGVPIALKDNLCTRGVRTTASSRMLESYVPPYDATAVTRLEAAGAVIVGKTNCDEFAMGSSTENSAFGPTRNPWALDRTPGGTSGGSAAAVAARMSAAALGSDTGGSIRQPAAMCGIVGLKPTYGRVSRYGLIAHGSSLDQIGPLALSAYDAALVMNAIAGVDPLDATSAPEPVPDFAAALTGDIRGLRIGVPWTLLDQGVDPEVSRALGTALDALTARGATLVDVALPHARYAIPVYYLVSTAEASSNLARYDGVRYGFRAPNPGLREPQAALSLSRGESRIPNPLREMYARTRAQGFGPEVKRRIMLGTYVLSAGYYDAYYLKAQQVRTLILRDYEQAFTGADAVDVIAMPTSPTPAFRIGEKVQDPLQMYLADVFTVSANLAGLPAISVPCGFTRGPAGPQLGDGSSSEGGLPVGLQLTGRRFDEATLLRVADAYERDTQWSKQPPPILSR